MNVILNVFLNVNHRRWGYVLIHGITHKEENKLQSSKQFLGILLVGKSEIKDAYDNKPIKQL